MPKSQNAQAHPIRTAVLRWLEGLPLAESQEADVSSRQDSVDSAPKRFTVYEPMALLSTGSFSSQPWRDELQRHNAETCASLWSFILRELSRTSKSRITHLAVNEGIPLHQADGQAENVFRSPSGLRMLHGDFGPKDTASGSATARDFDEAFWVSTKQNGVYQTWAPRWTMFSRGNVKEKARLLGFRKPTLPTSSHSEGWAADLYAGIGYFTFSYALMGMRVLCWELNPWSVEGLRRGAGANRWSVKVVQGDDLLRPTEELLAGGERIVVFLEDNQQAARRMRELQAAGLARDVAHVNCGLLPTSEPVWKLAWHMVASSPEAWLHLHENVGSCDKETRREAVQEIFESWGAAEGQGRTPRIDHVESVKTFAPGVEHVVFDVHITRSIIT